MAGPSARPPETPDSREAAAIYIASMLEGLVEVARKAQLPFLAYLIGVALEEAKNEKSGSS